ncbi:MAG: hypothetical protein ACN6RH_04635 [Stenotrophomonas rhizophila]|uniref:hypothetical protein n=1 Tax=Stenotrophomonas rhizophila TaxID=216778 RepID=UPI0010BFA3B2|nr:hypothetical protein [Stenotrophomonas rhizophila]
MSRTSPLSCARRWAGRARARTPLPLVAALLALLAAAPARAEDIPPQFMTQYEAVRDYLDLVQAAEAANAPTQMDSARAMQLLAAITNAHEILAPDYAPADLGLLVNACQYGKTVSTQLMQFGMAAMPAAVLIHPGGKASLDRRNADRFQPQLGLLLPYLLRCGARIQPLLDHWLSVATPEQRAELGPGGTDTLRRNAQRQYLEILEAMRAQPAGSALKRSLVRALAETAAPYARMLQPAQRPAVSDALSDAREQMDAADAALLQQAIVAFSDDGCGTLCAS